MAIPSFQSLLLFNSLYLNSVCSNSKQKLFPKSIESAKAKLKSKSDDDDVSNEKDVSTFI